MTIRITPLLIALAPIALSLTAPAVAAPGSVRDFQLVPTPTPTPTPQVQGPVDIEGAVPVAPRVIPTAAPTQVPADDAAANPAAASETPTTGTQSSGPLTTASTGTAPPTARPTRRDTAPAATSAPTISSIPTEVGSPSVATNALDSADTGSPDTSIPVFPAQPQAAATQTGTASETNSTAYLAWLAGFIGLIVLLGGAFVFWKRREPALAAVPQIEPPLQRVPRRDAEPKAEPEAAPLPAPAPLSASSPATAPPPDTAAAIPPKPAAGQIRIEAEASGLSRSMMNIALTYRIVLKNLGTRTLDEISISADMVTAHGKIPVSEQLADDTTDLQFAAVLAGIKPDQKQEITGECRLPVSAIRTIAQGQAQLYVPLLRVRIEAGGMDTMTRTFVVGITSAANKGRLQPFRLDEMAQTYRNVGLRALD